MGMNSSSYKWCCKSDIRVKGQTWVRKLEDDKIILAETVEELFS